MFLTRSPSLKAQATSGRAIVVSHGQPTDPDPAERELADFAADVAHFLPGWQVESATLAAPGTLDRALDRAYAGAGQGTLIYPMFMTGGWFTSQALRKRLTTHEATVLTPFGCDPDLPDLALDMICDALAAMHWQANDTQVFIAAHGSGRSGQSARDTRAFADALATQMRFAGLRVGYVEQVPGLAQAAAGLGSQSVCLPFFAAAGGHVCDDIPDALDQTGFKGVLLPPLGCAGEAPALVARALSRARVPA